MFLQCDDAQTAVVLQKLLKVGNALSNKVCNTTNVCALPISGWRKRKRKSYSVRSCLGNASE